MFCIAVDLGQAHERTAIVVMEHLQAQDREEPEFHVRHIERFRIGTSYQTMIERIREQLSEKLLSGSTLIIDGTGVGRPVVDLFKREGLSPAVAYITATGTAERDYSRREYRIPKVDLVSLLQVLFQDGRLKIAEGLPEAGILVQELLNFRAATGHRAAVDSIESWREGAHDDLVLATALACWWCEEGTGYDIGIHF